MRKTEIEINAMLKRIKTSPDGLDFIDYLKTLSQDNYLAFREGNSNLEKVYKGYAICVDKLIEAFEQCDNEVKKEPDFSDWTT